MVNQNEILHPRVIVNDHFDNIINKIDVKTETLLEGIALKQKSQVEQVKLQNELNEIREKQIETIKEIKKINLNNLPEYTNYKKEMSHILEENSLDYEHKVDLLKETFILNDCVLLEDPAHKNGLVLWITSWFYDLKSLEFLNI